MKCSKCGAEHHDYPFRVLQIQTLHVRDFGKNSRIQTLGDFEEYSVCKDCAQKKYAAYLDTRGAVRKAALLYGALMALGLVLTVLFWNGEGVLRLAGLGLLVGGGLCLYGGIQNVTRKQRELLAMTKETALYQCAFDCMVDAAPKKQDVNDLTYIPVNGDTLARKNGDLMILYDLLPQIAVEAHKRIHADAEGTE